MAEVDAQPASNGTTFGIQPVSGGRTPFGIQEQGTTTGKGIDEFSFRKILLNIDRHLMENDILALKYLCLDKNIGLSHGGLEKVNRGLDLLDKLERRGLLSKSKLEVLIELLGLIERFDLQREVKQCLDVQQKMRGIQAKKISSYRAMVLDFASDIGRKEFESLKPILKRYIPARTIERLNEPINLMIELEKLTVISPQKVKFLFEVAAYLEREDLVHKLEEFKGNYISHVAESLGEDEWKMLGYALRLSSRDMDGVHDAHGMLQKFQEGTKEEDQIEKLCSGLRSRLVGREDIALLLGKDTSIQPEIHGDTESMSPVADVSIQDVSLQLESRRDTESMSSVADVTTIDGAIQPESQGNTESVLPVPDVSTKDVSLQPESRRDTESVSPVADVTIDGAIQPESQGNTESVLPVPDVSTKEKCKTICWCMTKWIFLIGGIVLCITFGLMAILLKNDLGKKISEITAEISVPVTLIGFIMLIYDKCKASNCCPRNRTQTQSQPRQFTGTYRRVGSKVEVKMNIVNI